MYDTSVVVILHEKIAKFSQVQLTTSSSFSFVVISFYIYLNFSSISTYKRSNVTLKNSYIIKIRRIRSDQDDFVGLYSAIYVDV